MLHLILFSIIAISIFLITFFKLIKRNDTNYIYILAIEFVGLIMNFTYAFTGKNPSIYVYIIMYIFSVIIPLTLQIIEHKGTNISEIIYLIKIQLKKDEIKKILLDAIEKYPNSYLLHKKLAMYYEENKENEKAENEYMKAIRIQPKDTNLYYKLANILYSEKKSQEAIEVLNELLKVKPDYYQGSLLLGDIYYENEQFKEAVNTYNQAIRYNPAKYELYYKLGMSYTRLNDFKLAKEYYKKAATINSIKDVANLNLGQIELLFKEYDEAQKYFIEASKGEDEKITAEAYYYLAKIKMYNNEEEQAIQYCNIAIEINPNIIKKIEKDEELTKILGKLTLKENKIVVSKINKNQEEIVEYLGKTYNVVEKLTDYNNDYNNINKINKEKEL